MNFLIAFLLCAAAQVVSFYPLYLAWKSDKEKYGSDLGSSLKKRFAMWMVACPVWALPFAVMIGEVI